MSEFKVGDRVRVVYGDRSDPWFGKVGTITVINHNGSKTVAYDDPAGTSSENWAMDESLELLTAFNPLGLPHATFTAALDEVLAEVRATMIDRHSKYGPGNILRHGEMGVVVRLGDKYERLDHSREVDFADESTDDCVTDIIGYALILKLLRAKRWPGQS